MSIQYLSALTLIVLIGVTALGRWQLSEDRLLLSTELSQVKRASLLYAKSRCLGGTPLEASFPSNLTLFNLAQAGLLNQQKFALDLTDAGRTKSAWSGIEWLITGSVRGGGVRVEANSVVPRYSALLLEFVQAGRKLDEARIELVFYPDRDETSLHNFLNSESGETCL